MFVRLGAPMTVHPHKRRQAGFTYLLSLFVLAAFALSSLAVLELWSATARRERQKEIRWREDQFRAAIISYRASTPGQEKRSPRSFDDLLEDRRLAVPRRHLRRIYANPATGTPDWYVVRAPDGGISEVRSRP